MFRIKTDIRQFNCETQEKVEKLIRNWVIRPTDLIYHNDDKSWEPIGEHPDFGELFANLRDASDEDDVMTTTELDQISESLGASVADDAEPEEDEDRIELSVEHTGEDDGDEDDDSDEFALPPIEDSPLAGMSEIVAEDPESNAPPSGPMRAAILSGRGKIRKLAGKGEDGEGEEEEEETITVSGSLGPLPIPQAPEGVEGVASNPDEVTMMTERTAELLGLQDPEEEEEEEEEDDSPSQPLPLPTAPEGVEGVAPSDEPTNIFAREDEEEDEDEDDPEEEYVLEEIDASEASHVSSAEEDSEPRLGRHDLPEELFLTNELERPEDILAIDRQALLNELPEEAAPKNEEDWAEEVTQQIESPFDEEGGDGEDVDDLWGALSDADLQVSEVVDDADADDADEDEEEIRETIELDSPISRDDVPAADDLGDDAGEGGEKKESDRVFVDDDYSREADNLGSVDTEAFSAELEATSDVNDIDLSIDEIDEEGIDLGVEEELELFSTPTAPPPEIEDTEELVAPFSESEEEPPNISLEETDEFSTEALEEILDDKPAQNREFVSEGYSMPFPFKIQPSSADIEAGLVMSTATEEEKDIAFPRPLPKKLGEVTSRRYGYGDPPTRTPGDTPSPRISIASAPGVDAAEPSGDYSKWFLVFALVFFLLIVLTVVFLSS